ncbi:hypothetical protein ASZ90_011146 [hydrocarbon metagenome]|uniref:Uncharacterized protein n=1 Tax=hydrocarbon metagenome TaxID=938273 RepID=A0A0W8FEV3_9ZZZZ
MPAPKLSSKQAPGPGNVPKERPGQQVHLPTRPPVIAAPPFLVLMGMFWEQGSLNRQIPIKSGMREYLK